MPAGEKAALQRDSEPQESTNINYQKISDNTQTDPKIMPNVLQNPLQESFRAQFTKSAEQLKTTQEQLNNSIHKVVIPSNSSLTADSQIHLQKIVVQILTKSITRKMGIGVTFETTDEEDAFFRELVKQTIEAKLNPDLFYFEPMSDKSFSVQYQNYPIGKIKLTGRKTHMQILKGLYEIKSFDNLPLQEYILHIPEWIKHIQFCLK